MASALYRNACKLWTAMEDQAVGVGDLNDRDQYLVGMIPSAGCLGIWLGSLTALSIDVGLPSTSQYHEAKLTLQRMGCMSLLRRGCGRKASAWALLQRPSRELWDEHFAPLRDRSGRPRRQREPATTEAPAVPLRPEQIAEAIRVKVGSEVLVALDALGEELRTSNNSQARVAAARTLVFLARDGGTFDPDPLQRLADQLTAEMHATAPLEAP